MTRLAGLLLTALAVVYLDVLTSERLSVLGAAPALPLLVPLLLALRGRPGIALPSILLCAAIAAPFSAEPLPTLPLVYGGTAVALLAIREYLFLTHPLTEAIAAAACAALATGTVEAIHLVRFGAPGLGLLAARLLIAGCATGLLAPLAFRCLCLLPTMRGALSGAR
jgi:hypothetical protein